MRDQIEEPLPDEGERGHGPLGEMAAAQAAQNLEPGQPQIIAAAAELFLPRIRARRRRRNARRRRIDDDPAFVLAVERLDPRMRIAVAGDIVFAGGVPLIADHAGHIPRRHSGAAQDQRGRRSEQFAMRPPVLGQEILDRVARPPARPEPALPAARIHGSAGQSPHGAHAHAEARALLEPALHILRNRPPPGPVVALLDRFGLRSLPIQRIFELPVEILLKLHEPFGVGRIIRKFQLLDDAVGDGLDLARNFEKLLAGLVRQLHGAFLVPGFGENRIAALAHERLYLDAAVAETKDAGGDQRHRNRIARNHQHVALQRLVRKNIPGVRRFLHADHRIELVGRKRPLRNRRGQRRPERLLRTVPDAALVTVERTAPQIAGRLVADRPQRHPVGHGQKLRRHAGHEVRRRSELRGVPAGGVKLPDADPQKRVFETSEQVFVLAVPPVLQPDESDDRRQ